MSTQFKLFIDDNKNKLELFEYDYNQNSYRNILDQAYEKGYRQIIFTTSVFKKLIEKLYLQGFLLLDIKFIDSIEDYDFSEIKELINQININEGNKTLVNLLLKEIEWFVNDESIDIKSIVLLDILKKDKFEIYSNGVILCSNNKVEQINIEILTPIFIGA